MRRVYTDYQAGAIGAIVSRAMSAPRIIAGGSDPGLVARRVSAGVRALAGAAVSDRIAAMILILGMVMLGRLSSQSRYPEIHKLRSEDIIYAQLEESVQHFYASEKSGESPPELSIYSYTTEAPTDLFALSAALSLPYDSLATLNRLTDPGSLPKGRSILVPSIPGIFVAESPENDLEYLVKSLRVEDTGTHYPVQIAMRGRPGRFMFFPGSEFLASERSFFLVAGFRFPLPKGVISSGFGMRVDPIQGRVFKFHPGIDIAAPQGTQIFAARGGRVVEAGWSDVYGNYVLVVHDNDWETLYGHMSKILVSKGETVHSGDVLGLVGSTGIATGPHLHFEIRKRGVAENPLDLLAPKP